MAQFSVACAFAVRTLRATFDEISPRREQVAHRLTTLQRPGDARVPFFFIRVDEAGNITYRSQLLNAKY